MVLPADWTDMPLGKDSPERPKRGGKPKKAGRQRLPDFLRLLGLGVTVGIIVWLLYSDSVLPSCSISIHSVWDILRCQVGSIHSSELLMVGLLPVYVALMVFGGAFLGGYVIRLLFRCLVKR